jgi:hypothetical protein
MSYVYEIGFFGHRYLGMVYFSFHFGTFIAKTNLRAVFLKRSPSRELAA